jgi:tripartite-type tricarboxylate transporter receptor subunit TctC
MKRLLAILALLPALAFAWEPAKPISVVIGFQPGSGNEVGFRVLAAEVTKANPNANFLIELKPGADSVIASNYLYQAKPDGYTVSVPSYMGTYITNDIWQKDLKKWQYDSFSSVMGMGKSPLTIVANPSSKVNTVDELVDLVKTTKRPVNFAVGSGAHRMTFEYFMWKAEGNRDLVKYVQYQGPLQTVTATASDAGIEFGIMPISIALPLVKAGKVKVIGITGDQKLAGLPAAEPILVGGGYIDIYAAWSLALPPNAPSDIIEWFRKSFTAALDTPAVKQYYKDNLIIALPEELTPTGFDQHIKHLRSVWMPLADKVDLIGTK